jgi:hypothetical protein
MSANYAAVFANPIVEPGEYLARLVSVRAIPTDDGKHLYEVVVELDGNERQEDGTKLSAVLHPTQKAQRFIDALFSSFRINHQTLQSGIDRYASVYVYNSLYKGSAFSVVKFHPQPFVAREKGAELEAEYPKRVARQRKLNGEDIDDQFRVGA